MKILVSSLRLSETLRRIDVESIRAVEIDSKKYFKIHFGRMESISMPVESKSEPIKLDQENVRWDWICRDLRGIQEQPILIEFAGNKAIIRLDY